MVTLSYSSSLAPLIKQKNQKFGVRQTKILKKFQLCSKIILAKDNFLKQIGEQLCSNTILAKTNFPIVLDLGQKNGGQIFNLTQKDFFGT